MSTTARRSRRPLRVQAAAQPIGAALAALVAGLVLGIFGMHALASHGTPAGAASSMSVMAMSAAHEAAMASGGPHGGHAHAAATHSSMTAAAANVGPGSGSGHDMASMAMLCVALLAAAAMTLLVLLGAGILRPLQPAAFRPVAVYARALPWVRGTGPPHEWQFSVIRC